MYSERRNVWRQILQKYDADIRVVDGIAGYGARAYGLLDLPPFISEVLIAVASSGFTTAVYNLVKALVDARNGRRLKIRVGDIEVEATQMAEKEVLRVFELLQDKADRAKIRGLLLDAASKGERPNSHHTEKGNSV